MNENPDNSNWPLELPYTMGRSGLRVNENLAFDLKDGGMTHEELMKEILQLPVAQRLELARIIAREIKEEMAGRISLSGSLLGIAKPDGPMPTDEELDEERIRYLTEKYS